MFSVTFAELANSVLFMRLQYELANGFVLCSILIRLKNRPKNSHKRHMRLITVPDIAPFEFVNGKR